MKMVSQPDWSARPLCALALLSCAAALARKSHMCVWGKPESWASEISGLQHRVIFAPNLNTTGAIDLLTPDGLRLRSTPVGLAYYDAATGQSVFIAQIKDSTGELVAPNQALYRDAFDGVLADVRLTYTRAGLEQVHHSETETAAAGHFWAESADDAVGSADRVLRSADTAEDGPGAQARPGRLADG